MQTPTEERQIHTPDWLTDIVIGLSDGLTLPFAISAGLSGLIGSTHTLFLAGLGITAACAVILGLGGYFASKSNSGKELPQKLDLSKEVQQLMAEDNAKDQKEWNELMQQYQINVEQTAPKRAAASALIIILSYIAGSLVPLSPYFFLATPIEALKLSVIITLVALFVFGFWKGRITGGSSWVSALRSTLIGAAAAGAAFGVATLIQG